MLSKLDEQPIKAFKGAYRFLSNFYPARILYEGMIYRSAEHAYQAAKSDEPLTRERISRLIRPAEAKEAGRELVIRDDWEEIKVREMKVIVSAKFKDEGLATALLSTGVRHLYEGNWWDDSFWGVDGHTLKGQNHLGKILMEVRQEIRDAKATAF